MLSVTLSTLLHLKVQGIQNPFITVSDCHSSECKDQFYCTINPIYLFYYHSLDLI